MGILLQLFGVLIIVGEIYEKEGDVIGVVFGSRYNQGYLKCYIAWSVSVGSCKGLESMGDDIEIE